jgi:serine/threonine-protein kinase
MSEQVSLEQILERIADGQPVDWEHAERGVADGEREVLRHLRVLSALGETHQSVPSSLEAVTSSNVVASPSAMTTALPSTPQRWGRYRLVRQIGRGSYGVVYLARDDDLERDVAIKLLHLSFALRSDVKAEGRTLAAVRHPNVVTVYGVEESGAQLALCMEYIHGRTLDDIVRSDGPMNAEEAVVAGQAIGRALAAVHHVGILHRDVKARNVMRERAGRYVLMDLGAGLQADAPASGNVGTPIYMAPELLEGAAATRQTDVYALGVLLYFLVTGSYPVSGKSSDEIRAAHRSGQRFPLHERRPDLPDAFVRAVERATAPRADERYDSPMALLRDLNAAATPASNSTDTAVMPAPAGWVVVARQTAIAAVTMAVVVLLSGVIAARAFNLVIDRPAAFDSSGLGETIKLGFEASVLPAAVFAVLLGVASVVRMVVGLVPPVRRSLRRLWTRIEHVLGTDPEQRPTVIAGVAVVIGFVGLAVVYLLLTDVFLAHLGSLSDSDLQRFEPFMPLDTRTLSYRLAFPAVLLLVTVIWMQAEAARRVYRGLIPIGVRVAAAGLTVILIALMQAPYKLMTVNNEMPVVMLDDRRCHLLGRSQEQWRVYCASWPVPRVRTLATPAMTHCNFEENVFMKPSATGCTR